MAGKENNAVSLGLVLLIVEFSSDSRSLLLVKRAFHMEKMPVLLDCTGKMFVALEEGNSLNH